MTQQMTTSTVFDALRRTRPDDSEFWSARELLPALGYARWENAQSAITRAALNSGQRPEDHLRATTKRVSIGSGAARDVLDYDLTRYGAHHSFKEAFGMQGAPLARYDSLPAHRYQEAMSWLDLQARTFAAQRPLLDEAAG